MGNARADEVDVGAVDGEWEERVDQQDAKTLACKRDDMPLCAIVRARFETSKRNTISNLDGTNCVKIKRCRERRAGRRARTPIRIALDEHGIVGRRQRVQRH